MTLPPNKEVAPNGAKDWNDKSVDGDKPYGLKLVVQHLLMILLK